MTRGPNYSARDVRLLVEGYQELKAAADTDRRGLRYLAELADIDWALDHLSLKYWAVVLLHGLLMLPQDVTAEALHISQPAVSKRYRLALEELHYHINGGA